MRRLIIELSLWFVFLPLILWAQLDFIPTDFFPQETSHKTTILNTPITISGRVIDHEGNPLVGCKVTMTCGAETHTFDDGTFHLVNVTRSNQLLTVQAPGYYQEIVPLKLFLPLFETNVSLPPIIMWPTNGVIRFLFGGDTAFARRMLDPLERARRDQLPFEHPDALISVSNPLPGTLRVVGYVRPIFLSVDYPVLNFESVVTLDPSTPHWEKDYVYFTLPGSLPALKTLNIDYVGLGNNHLYDYLESGISNTLYYFREVGINFSGAGANSQAAFTPFRKTIKGIPCSFLAMTSIGGEQHAITYYAASNKGGAAYIEFTNESTPVINTEKTLGYLTIVQAHVGFEYTYEPLPPTLKWFRFCVDAGADLVVGHHPHVAQGFGIHNGMLIIHSLGNLFFDQVRLETMLGLIAIVDMDYRKLRFATGVPVCIEDFRPRFTCGHVEAVLLRRIGEVSREIRVFPYLGRAWVTTNFNQYTFEDRHVEIQVMIPTNGETIIDLRRYAKPYESLCLITASERVLTVRPGRDIMYFGDFEDVDVDEDIGEISRWYYGSQSTASVTSPYAGTASLCMRRSSNTQTSTDVFFRNRIRVIGDAINQPNKEVTLFGYLKAQDAGRLTITAEYAASEGSNTFGEELIFQHPGGTHDWTQFFCDLHMPPDAPNMVGDPSTNAPRAIRLAFRHHSPQSGVGFYWLDELAMVNWEETIYPCLRSPLKTPHARDFLRIIGPPGTYTMGLTFRSYRPIQADAQHGPHLRLEPSRLWESTEQLKFKPVLVGGRDTQKIIIQNLGNRPLLISSPTFSGPAAGSFYTKWKTMNGSEIHSPTLSVPPRSRAILEVAFVPTNGGQHIARMELRSNDPDPSEAVREISLLGIAEVDVPVRRIYHGNTGPTLVEIQLPDVAPEFTNTMVKLEEQLPTNIVPSYISHNGLWDTNTHKIVWERVSINQSVYYTLPANSNQVIALPGKLRIGPSELPVGGETNAVIGPAQDSDEDGLPDWWEFQFFDSATGAEPTHDPDGDGKDNWMEFVAGSHPMDASSCHGFSPVIFHTVTPQRGLELTVAGVENVLYAIEQSDDLVNWSVVVSNLLSGHSVMVPMDSPPAGYKFFRAVTQTSY